MCSTHRVSSTRGKEPTMLNKGDFMSDTDLKAQFGKISDTARTATGKVEAAGERTREQLEADVAAARDRIAAAADRMSGKMPRGTTRHPSGRRFVTSGTPTSRRFGRAPTRRRTRSTRTTPQWTPTWPRRTHTMRSNSLSTRSRKPSTRRSTPFTREPTQRRSKPERRNLARVCTVLTTESAQLCLAAIAPATSGRGSSTCIPLYSTLPSSVRATSSAA